MDFSLLFESPAVSAITKVNSRLKCSIEKVCFYFFLLGIAITKCHFDFLLKFGFNSITYAIRNKLQVTQMIRFELNPNTKAHTCISKYELAFMNWLPVSRRVDFNTLCHVFFLQTNSALLYYRLFCL